MTTQQKNDINLFTASFTTSFPGGDGLTKVTSYYLYKLNNDDGDVDDDNNDYDSEGDSVRDSDDADNDV